MYSLYWQTCRSFKSAKSLNPQIYNPKIANPQITKNSQICKSVPYLGKVRESKKLFKSANLQVCNCGIEWCTAYLWEKVGYYHYYYGSGVESIPTKEKKHVLQSFFLFYGKSSQQKKYLAW
jgi:hypothetical protein